MMIAVLEKHPDVGEMLQHGLKLVGHSVVVYSRPALFFAALLVSASAPFDCLIVDLPLTESMTGGEIVRRVRKSFPTLPVILIIEGSSWEIEAARRDLPSVEALPKPFKLTTLLCLLKRLATGVER
jgi:DNA-binding response OmpR family regulator